MEREERALGVRYAALLSDYLLREDERAIPALQALSAEFVRCRVGPDEVVALHSQALAEQLRGFPSAQVAEVSLRSLDFLRAAMRAFGLDPLRPYLEATVTNRFVGLILRDLERTFHVPDVARVHMGCRYADNIEGDLANYLDMFRLQGLGQLALESVDETRGEVVFTGRDVFESYEPSCYPQDHFTRGFLARAVSALAQREMNCEEVACQAQGAPTCRFVVTPVATEPIANLRRLLER